MNLTIYQTFSHLQITKSINLTKIRFTILFTNLQTKLLTCLTMQTYITGDLLTQLPSYQYSYLPKYEYVPV